MNRLLTPLALSALTIACGEPPAPRPSSARDAFPSPGSAWPSKSTASVSVPPGGSVVVDESPPPDEVSVDLAVEPPSELPAFNASLVRALGTKGVRLLEVAASVCGAAVKADENGVLRVGCRSCAPFTREYGPDGSIVELGSEDAFYELEHASFGSFTRVGADEVAATFAGCEPYAGNYGGTLIAERKEKGSPIWVGRSYRSGLHPALCEPLTLLDSRQLLICRWVTGKQTTSDNLEVYDFSKGTEEDVSETATLAFSVDEDVYGACFNGSPPGESIQGGAIERFTIQPNGASVSKVILDVTFGATKRGAAFDALCKRAIDEINKENGRPVNLSAAVPRKKVQLTLVWNGTELVLDEGSAKRWKAVQPNEHPVE